MASLTCFNRRFTPNWRMTSLALLAILILTRLGFWQLARAEEKMQMLTQQASFATRQPVPWSANKAMPQQYQQIRVKGRYLPQILFLDNQHFQHQWGYHVLNPLQLESNKIVLVDRGWVKGNMDRQILPDVVVPVGLLEITGSVYYPSQKNWVLGQPYEKRTENIAMIERIDPKLIGQFLHKSVYPFIIRLDKKAAQGYVRHWPVVAMPPERHHAYAFQWFAMAFAVLVLFIVLNLQKK